MKARTLVIAGAAVVVVAGLAMWTGKDTVAAARMGSVYVAKQFCSCRFVAGRSEESCRTDFDAEQIAPLHISVGANGVTTSALGGLVSATAQFEPGYGCRPAR